MREIRALSDGDGAALARFFAKVVADPDSVRYFHPHPLDEVTAQKIASSAAGRRDRYFAAFDGGEVVGYGMLRGWDEGYEIPAFGVCVLPEARGQGLGRELLAWAIAEARAAGAKQLMLKVYPENDGAVRLYERAGFSLSPYPNDPAQLVGCLELAE